MSYEREWNRFRRLHRVTIAMWVLWLPIGAVPVNLLKNNPLAMMIVAVCYISTAAIIERCYLYFRCPQCGHVLPQGRPIQRMVEVSQCANCGLKRPD